MSGGTISGNASSSSSSYYSSYYPDSYAFDGGGVYVSSGTFTMSGGTISGNTSYATASGYSYSYSIDCSGGGVYVSSGTFIKSATGGIIYGSDALPELQNTATGRVLGYAVLVYDSWRIKYTTVNAGDYLNSGSSAGWE
jgi:hypothetical protein